MNRKALALALLEKRIARASQEARRAQCGPAVQVLTFAFPIPDKANTLTLSSNGVSK